MPTGGSASRQRPDLLVDTSAAVPLVVVDHEHHIPTIRTLDGQRLGLAGYAAFETYSVLTRLPAPSRRSPDAVTRLLTANFPASRFLSGAAAEALLTRLAADGIAGGSVYDALVAAAAVEHGVELATRDRRALDTYRTVGADVVLLADT